MLRASITLAAVSAFHDASSRRRSTRKARAAAKVPGRRAERTVRTDADNRRTHGEHAEARRLLPALLGREGRRASTSRSRSSTATSSTRPASPPASGRTTSASTGRDRPATAASSRSSGSGRRCCSCSTTSRSNRPARTRPSGARSKTRSPVESCGDSASPPEQRPRPGGRDRLPAPRRARRGPRAQARPLPRGPHAQRDLHAAHESVPAEHEIETTLTFTSDTGGERAAASAGPCRVRRQDRDRAGRTRGTRRRRGIRRRPVYYRHRRQRDAVARLGDAARARLARPASPTMATRRAGTTRGPATAA